MVIFYWNSGKYDFQFVFS